MKRLITALKIAFILAVYLLFLALVVVKGLELLPQHNIGDVQTTEEIDR
jgi:hypothetical protein